MKKFSIFNFQFSIHDNRGVTLFIAIVIMGILLFISFAVVNIAIKSTIFASSGRDSQLAFYAADAGLECAIYWDTKVEPSKFASAGSTFSCGGYTIQDTQAIAGTSTPTSIGVVAGTLVNSVFGFEFDRGVNQNNACVIVTVRKNLTTGVTYIKSRGYNTCENTGRRIERGVEVTY